MSTVNETFISETEKFDFISETRRPYKIYETRRDETETFQKQVSRPSRDRDYIPEYYAYNWAVQSCKSCYYKWHVII